MRAAPADADTCLVVEEAATIDLPNAEQPPEPEGDRSPIPSREGLSSPLDRLSIEEDSGLKKYRLGEPLGRGAYGEVFKCMVAGRFLAVKKINLQMLEHAGAAADKEINMLLQEINTLKRLAHPRIVQYKGCIRDDEPALLIFLEYMPSGSIKSVLDKFGPYGSLLAKKYTRQILEGLEFLHGERVLHRDVKGANVLIDPQGDAKLADFGACKELEALHSTMTGVVGDIHGSVFWMAPEVMKYKAGRRSDIWSLGCVVIEMITAEAPWPELRKQKLGVTETLKRIVDGDGPPPFPEKISTDCRLFLEATLTRDPSRRPYAADLLRHRYIRQDAPKPDGPPAPPEAWG